MDISIKIVAVSICAVLISQVVRKQNPELSSLICLMAGIVILMTAVSLMSEVSYVWDIISRMSGISSSVYSPLMKCVAISILAKIAVDVCKDAGSAYLASTVELCASIAALICSLALIKSFLLMMEDLL